MIHRQVEKYSVVGHYQDESYAYEYHNEETSLMSLVTLDWLSLKVSHVHIQEFKQEVDKDGEHC